MFCSQRHSDAASDIGVSYHHHNSSSTILDSSSSSATSPNQGEHGNSVFYDDPGKFIILLVSQVCKVTCQCSRVYRPILRFLCSPARLPRARPRAHAKGDICDSGMQTHKYCKEYAHYTTNSGVSTTDIYFLWQFWAIPCSSSHTILNIQYLIIEMHVGQDRQAQGADIR